MIVRRSIAMRCVCLSLLGAAPALAASASPYDFSYRILGDRRVAPVQVFDDGRDTYIQFRAGQTVPAIFSVDAAGERLAEHRASGSYVIVAGTGRQLVMRIGDVSAAAQYEGAARRSGMLPAGPGQDDVADAVPVSLARGGASQVSPGPSWQQMRPQPAASRPALPRAGFEAAVADQNMRKLLERWARDAGWTFNAEHWAVDVDIPLAGAAAFDGDFKGAVRQLLASTELSTKPVQPCFYSNRVLRVIPLVESCNRTRAVTAAH